MANIKEIEQRLEGIRNKMILLAGKPIRSETENTKLNMLLRAKEKLLLLRTSERLLKAFRIGSAILAYSLIFCVILAVFCLLWNNIIPEGFGGPRLNIFKAALLFALFRVLCFDWLTVFNRYLKSADIKLNQLIKEFIEN
jgi:hypothetical protein